MEHSQSWTPEDMGSTTTFWTNMGTEQSYCSLLQSHIPQNTYQMEKCTFSSGAQSRQWSDAITWFTTTWDPKIEFDYKRLATILNSAFSATIRS